MRYDNFFVFVRLYIKLQLISREREIICICWFEISDSVLLDENSLLRIHA